MFVRSVDGLITAINTEALDRRHSRLLVLDVVLCFVHSRAVVCQGEV